MSSGPNSSSSYSEATRSTASSSRSTASSSRSTASSSDYLSKLMTGALHMNAVVQALRELKKEEGASEISILDHIVGKLPSADRGKLREKLYMLAKEGHAREVRKSYYVLDDPRDANHTMQHLPEEEFWKVMRTSIQEL